jgi:broad specificity phosphatase PhoE
MKFIILSLISLMSFFLPVQTVSANTDNQFTVYLVRHAEKLLDRKNPPLTPCGIRRAEQLSVMLEKANIKAIYSTEFIRTEQTAAPLAKKLALTVQPYSPRDLEKFATQIKNKKQNVVIVGHSNTTPQLTALISSEEVKDITEKEYQMLYQIHFSNKKSKLTLLKQPLVCQ